jgi:hypothetical protein
MNSRHGLLDVYVGPGLVTDHQPTAACDAAG